MSAKHRWSVLWILLLLWVVGDRVVAQTQRGRSPVASRTVPVRCLWEPRLKPRTRVGRCT